MDAHEIQFIFAVVETRPEFVGVQVCRHGDSLSFATSTGDALRKRARLGRSGLNRWTLQRPMKRRRMWYSPWFYGSLEEALEALGGELTRLDPWRAIGAGSADCCEVPASLSARETVATAR